MMIVGLRQNSRMLKVISDVAREQLAVDDSSDPRTTGGVGEDLSLLRVHA